MVALTTTACVKAEPTAKAASKPIYVWVGKDGNVGVTANPPAWIQADNMHYPKVTK
jgi:hypothetical protein